MREGDQGPGAIGRVGKASEMRGRERRLKVINIIFSIIDLNMPLIICAFALAQFGARLPLLVIGEFSAALSEAVR
jgi:hypothetical protein